GPCGSPANGPVRVVMTALPGLTAVQVASAPPSAAGWEMHRMTDSSVLVNGSHDWCGEGSVWMRSVAPGVRHTVAGWSPRRAVTVPRSGQPVGEGPGGVVCPGW